MGRDPEHPWDSALSLWVSSCLWEAKSNDKLKISTEFPGGPVVRIPCFPCWDPGFKPWLENYYPVERIVWPKKKKTQKPKPWQIAKEGEEVCLGFCFLVSLTALFSWLFFIFFFFFCHMARGILVPWPGIEHHPSVLEAQSLNSWTTREVLLFSWFWREAPTLPLCLEPSNTACPWGQDTAALWASVSPAV